MATGPASTVPAVATAAAAAFHESSASMQAVPARELTRPAKEERVVLTCMDGPIVTTRSKLELLPCSYFRHCFERGDTPPFAMPRDAQGQASLYLDMPRNVVMHVIGGLETGGRLTPPPAFSSAERILAERCLQFFDPELPKPGFHAVHRMTHPEMTDVTSVDLSGGAWVLVGDRKECIHVFQWKTGTYVGLLTGRPLHRGDATQQPPSPITAIVGEDRTAGADSGGIVFAKGNNVYQWGNGADQSSLIKREEFISSVPFPVSRLYVHWYEDRQKRSTRYIWACGSEGQTKVICGRFSDTSVVDLNPPQDIRAMCFPEAAGCLPIMARAYQKLTSIVCDSRYIVRGDENGDLHIYTIAFGCERVVKAHAAPVHALALCKDTVFTAAGTDPVIRVWSIESGEPLGVLTPDETGHGGRIVGLRAHRDGSVISASEDGVIAVLKFS